MHKVSAKDATNIFGVFIYRYQRFCYTDSMTAPLLKEQEDMILRNFLANNPSHIDLDDPTIFCYDKDGNGLNARNLHELDLAI